MFVGPLPRGGKGGPGVDHLCRNRLCVNPSPLELVTARVNILRGNGASARNLRKTHCPYGHPYADENLIINIDGNRVCRTCKRRRARFYYQRSVTRGATP